MSNFLWVGLGNPGRLYLRNRHNLGFMVIEALGEELKVQGSKMQLGAQVEKVHYEGQSLILARPQSFMNCSGEVVQSLVRFFKLESHQIGIIHDDLDLPAFECRLRQGGGTGGHNGLRSIEQHLGAQAFRNTLRLRMGIGHPGRGPQVPEVADFVLSNFQKHDSSNLDLFLEKAVLAVSRCLRLGLARAMNEVNKRPTKKGEDSKGVKSK